MVAAQDAAGALAVAETSALAGDVDDATFAHGLAIFANFVGEDAAAPVITAAKAAAAPNQDNTAAAFFEAAKAALDYATPGQHVDAELAEDASHFTMADTPAGADDLLSRYAVPFTLCTYPGSGAAQGLGDTVASVYQGARSAVLWALNKLTYYTMKKRAGIIGEALAATVLSPLVCAKELRLHLVGHSFGGRLVTAAVNKLVFPQNVTLASVTLLEAAYSHNGMTDGSGAFAAVVGKPRGPLCITHTHNDLACTLAYPLASRVSGDTTKSIGDAKDPFGAMGANGPQGLAAEKVAICDPQMLDFEAGIINTILADSFIIKTDSIDAHNNVTNPTCGKLVAAAITTPTV